MLAPSMVTWAPAQTVWRQCRSVRVVTRVRGARLSEPTIDGLYTCTTFPSFGTPVYVKESSEKTEEGYIGEPVGSMAVWWCKEGQNTREASDTRKGDIIREKSFISRPAAMHTESRQKKVNPNYLPGIIVCPRSSLSCVGVVCGWLGGACQKRLCAYVCLCACVGACECLCVSVLFECVV